MKHFGPHICARCKDVVGDRVRVELTDLVWPGGRARMTPQQARVMEAILAGIERRDAIIQHVWANDASGGPLSARNAVAVHVHHLRGLLDGAGFPGKISSVAGGGYTITVDQGALG